MSQPDDKQTNANNAEKKEVPSNPSSSDTVAATSSKATSTTIAAPTPTDYVLPVSIARNLGDKLYEKRKLGALEVDQLVKDLLARRDANGIRGALHRICTDFIESTNGNAKKGGLIALAAAAIGLGSECTDYVGQLLPPVVACFTDQDMRVRYYACESLYNIAKVSRGRILMYFNEVFDALCKLSADPDTNVKNGANLLDRLVKDIVTEVGTFDVDRFIPLLQERIYVINPFCRQFIISWIQVLDSVPDIDMLQHLPKFMDGLFNMLKDQTKGIQPSANATLCEFLHEIGDVVEENTVDFSSLVRILLEHCVSKDDFTRYTALVFVREFLNIGGRRLLPDSADLLGGILPSQSHESEQIQEAAVRANASLMKLVNEAEEFDALQEFLNTLNLQFLHKSVQTRVAALRWFLMLHEKMPSGLVEHMDTLLPSLLKALSDSSEIVVRLDLEVLAKMASNEKCFDKLMSDLILLFRSDAALLQQRSSLIVRQLSVHLSSEKIYRTFASILVEEKDTEFASLMVQTLNLILLTSAQLSDLRNELKELDTDARRALFRTLYKSWAHNPSAVFSLCLLCGVYEHACALIAQCATLEITVGFLMEIDKLVQLLESPIFIHLRLQLLEPAQHPHLFKCLFGLLMLLPQSAAFELLRNRLSVVSSLNVLQLTPKSKAKDDSAKKHKLIDFELLLVHFKRVQEEHMLSRRRKTEAMLNSTQTTTSTPMKGISESKGKGSPNADVVAEK